MVAILTGSEIGFSGSLGFSGSCPHSSQEVYEKMEGEEFILHWDKEKQLILMLCNNIYCIHHRDVPGESVMEDKRCTNCTICYKILDDLTYFKVPSPMMDMIIKQTMARTEVIGNMPDEKKKCFKYEESTTSKW
jgi:hypothetical protein